ncbi:MAG: glycosyltransferase family 2 protein [Deltaproteobacteria bacterium]|nr:glycosyltransferase family 2 protein [Deltaproteobacteria bacterium]
MGRSLAVLVVLYKSERFINGLAECLKQQSYKDFDVHVLDCHEEQKSLRFFRGKYPGIKSYPYQGNLGYAGGNNFLYRQIMLQGGYSFTMVLNPDVILAKDAVEQLVILQRLTGCIGCGPIIFKGKPYNESEIQNYVIKADYFKGRMIFPGNVAYNKNNLDVNKTELLSGTIFLIKNIFSQCLFPDENYMYGEELDIGYRINQLGGKNYVTSKSKVWHIHDFNGESNSAERLRYYYINRNRILFFYRYRKYNSLFFSIIFEFIKLPARCLWVVKKKNARLLYAIYLGLFHGYLRRSGKYEKKIW